LRALLKGAAMVNWDRLLAEAKTFFSSGLFFMLLGGLIMYFGYRLSNDPFTHSAFVFLVVILGLALFLFGTGTSASGEGTSGQVKVAIASSKSSTSRSSKPRRHRLLPLSRSCQELPDRNSIRNSAEQRVQSRG